MSNLHKPHHVRHRSIYQIIRINDYLYINKISKETNNFYNIGFILLKLLK